MRNFRLGGQKHPCTQVLRSTFDLYQFLQCWTKLRSRVSYRNSRATRLSCRIEFWRYCLPLQSHWTRFLLTDIFFTVARLHRPTGQASAAMFPSVFIFSNVSSCSNIRSSESIGPGLFGDALIVV